MKKSHFRTATLRVVKCSVYVERQKTKKKTIFQVVNASVVNESLKHSLERARNYMNFVCGGLRAHSLWKSDLLKGLASFDYSVLFLLPKEQAASYDGSLFKGFIARGRALENRGHCTVKCLWLWLTLYVMPTMMTLVMVRLLATMFFSYAFAHNCVEKKRR